MTKIIFLLELLQGLHEDAFIPSQDSSQESSQDFVPGLEPGLEPGLQLGLFYFFFSQKNNKQIINLETNKNSNYYLLLVITWVSLMTFPRYGVDRDFSFFIGNVRSLYYRLVTGNV